MAATTIDRPDDLRKTTRGQLQSPLPQEGRSKEKRSKETIIETKIIRQDIFMKYNWQAG